eukprot:TRINITY_DN103787_c0_g1_i1.p1 TRINITY_DN103787_c0_g1~~TRINITY_DN103787_c0_g1_i1.p1  ORF type:complete len:413 (-),score=108.63 TRINITY_DN103787_c0_g1_i1:301-1539(-)
MAPVPVAKSATSNQENRCIGSAASKINKGPAAKAATTRKPLADTGNIGNSSANEKKGTSTRAGSGNVATSPRTAFGGGVTSPRGAASPRPASSNTRSATAAATRGPDRARRGTVPRDPWEDVRKQTAEVEELEAELARLEAELEAAEQETLEAQAKEREAEEQFTLKSAEMLSEYAAAHERCITLEEELRGARNTFDSLRKENLDLSRRSIELNKALENREKDLKEAKTLLEKCTNSHGSLDAEIAQRLKDCEQLREAARGQCERLSRDCSRFTSMKERLSELVETASEERKKEVQELLDETTDMVVKTQAALVECERVVRDGIAPSPPVVDELPSGSNTEDAQLSAETADMVAKTQAALADSAEVVQEGIAPTRPEVAGILSASSEADAHALEETADMMATTQAALVESEE